MKLQAPWIKRATYEHLLINLSGRIAGVTCSSPSAVFLVTIDKRKGISLMIGLSVAVAGIHVGVSLFFMWLKGLVYRLCGTVLMLYHELLLITTSVHWLINKSTNCFKTYKYRQYLLGSVRHFERILLTTCLCFHTERCAGISLLFFFQFCI